MTRRPPSSRITRVPTRSSASISAGLSVMGLRDLRELAPIRAPLARHRHRERSRGMVPRLGRGGVPFTRPNRYAGAAVLRGACVGPTCLPTMRRTPPKARGCEAGPFAPSQSQIAGSVGGGRLGCCGHVDVACRFFPGRWAPAFYGCWWRRQKKARTGKRGATGRALTRVLRAGACIWGMPRLQCANARCAEK
jgi:hypothetical protein